MSMNLKNILFTSTALVAISIVTPALAAEQNHNTDGAGAVNLTVGNSAIWSGTAAGLDEIFSVSNNVNVGEGGIVVSASTLDGVGTLYFSGNSVVTGTIGSTGNSIGLINATTSGIRTINISGNTFVNTITNTVGNSAGDSIVFNFGANVTSTNLNIVTNGDTSGNNTVATTTIAGNLTNTGTINITATNDCGNCEANLVLSGTTNALGTVVLTNNSTDVTDITSLTLNGSGAQTASGTIDGNAANKGDLIINNTGTGVTFADAVGGTSLLRVVTVTDGEAIFSDVLKATTSSIAVAGTLTTNGATTTNVVFTGAGAANINDSLTGTIAFAGNDATVTLGDGSSVSSTVDATSADTGTLNTSGTTTVSGNVGATQNLKEVNVNGIAGKTATFSGTVESKTVTSGAGTAKFDAALTVTDLKIGGTGDVDLNALGTGSIDFDADGSVDIGANWVGSIDSSTADEGTLTFSAASAGVTTIGITNALKKIEILGSGNTVVATNVKSSNTLALGDNNVFAPTGTFDVVSGQNITLTITDTAGSDYGRINAGGIVTIADGAIITVDLAGDENVAEDDIFAIITGAAGSSYGDLTINSASLDWGFEGSVVGDNYVLKAVIPVVGTSNTDLAYVQIRAANDGGVLDALEAAIAAAGTQAAKDELIESAMPTVDGSSQSSLIDAVSSVQAVADNRITIVRSGNAISSSGLSAGSLGNKKSIWAQGYYSDADQDVRGAIDGYNSNTAGVMLGVDKKNIIDDTILGLAVNYGVTNANSDNANRTGTDISSYGLTFYSSRVLEENVFVNAQLGYVYNNIETARYDCGGAGLLCSGETSSDQYFAKLAFGYDKVFKNGAVITPKVSAAYVSVNTDGYTETGTGGGANLTIEDVDMAALNLGIDVNASWKFKAENVSIIPSINVGYAYDVIGDESEVSSNFTGGGASFKTTGPNPERDTLKLGASVAYEIGSTWSVFASYDAKLKEKYSSNNLALTLKANF